MYQLTKRQESILYYILTGKENMSVKKLAVRYKLSERTIQYDLDHINAWLGERGGELRRSKASGISFDGSQAVRERIQADAFQQDMESHIPEKSERLAYVWNRIVLAEEAVTSEQLVEEMKMSRPTVMTALKEVEQQLAGQHLGIAAKKGAGYQLEGKETLIRGVIEDTLHKILIRYRITNYDTLYTALPNGRETSALDFKIVMEYLGAIDVYSIYDSLNILRREYGIFLSDTDSFRLFLSMVVMVRRIRAGRTIPKEDITHVKRNEWTRRYVLARGICEQLEDDYEIECAKPEVIYMLLRLVSCNLGFEKHDEEASPSAAEEELGATIELMLQVLKDYEIVRVADDQMQNLKEDLYEYLNLIMHKRKLQIGTPNPLLMQTKAGYPHIFKETVRMAEIFSRREGVELTEEEIGTITIYIAAYAEVAGVTGHKRVLIVSNEGKGLSRLLYNRVKNNIPQLDIQGVVSVNELNHRPGLALESDLIISTTELPHITIPVFCVSPIISVFDIRYITDYITGRTSLKVLEDLRQQENFLERAVMAVLGSYMDLDQLEAVRQELEYILAAGTGQVTAENTQLIQEEYAYKVSMVFVKLTEMMTRIEQETGTAMGAENGMGLVIHIVMSVTRWENRNFLPERTLQQERMTGQDEDAEAAADRAAIIWRNVLQFLEAVEELFHSPIDRSEAVAISRYF